MADRSVDRTAHEQLLVCFSPSPSSARVIQVAADTAISRNMRLIALHMENSRNGPVKGDASVSLEKNRELAKRLGAEIVVIRGKDFVREILGFARLHNISRIVIGRRLRPEGPAFFASKTDPVNRLLARSGKIEIQVVPGRPEDYAELSPRNRRLYERTPLISGRLFRILVSAGIMALTTACSLLFSFIGISETNIAILYLGATVLVTVLGGRLIGIISVFAAMILFEYLFVEPFLKFSFSDPQYLVTLAMMFTAAVIANIFTGRLRQLAVGSQLRERRIGTIYRISHALLTVSGKEAILNAAIRDIPDILPGSVVIFIRNEKGFLLDPVYRVRYPDSEDTLVSTGERNIADWTFSTRIPSGKGTENFPESCALYLPLSAGQDAVGVIGFTPSVRNPSFDPEERSLLQVFAEQLSLALSREFSLEQREKADIRIEKEVLRLNLLRSISHDLRTPLAGIVGSSSAILEMPEGTFDGTVRELVTGIYEQAVWLSDIVNNLLSLTRIQGNDGVVKKDGQLLDDVIASAVRKMKNRLASHPLTTILPDHPVLVPMDILLMEQVLVNLLDNTVKYTPPGTPVEIAGSCDGGTAVITVSDRGPGIPGNDLEKVFEAFYSKDPLRKNEKHGIGLGLQICRTVVNAHGGSIRAENRKDGGAVFRIELPVPPENDYPGGFRE